MESDIIRYQQRTSTPSVTVQKTFVFSVQTGSVQNTLVFIVETDFNSVLVQKTQFSVQRLGQSRRLLSSVKRLTSYVTRRELGHRASQSRRLLSSVQRLGQSRRHLSSVQRLTSIGHQLLDRPWALTGISVEYTPKISIAWDY